MKKITLSLIAALATIGSGFAQVNTTIQAPQYDGSNSSLSTPSGSTDAVYHRACWLILQSEMTNMLLTNSVVTNFGVDYTQGVNIATAGQVTVSLENTADVAYNKGTAWPACLTGMTTHYTGTYNLPVANGFTSVSVPLTTPFNYGGGGVYVAFEWYAPAAASTQWARAQCNTTGLSTTGGARGIANATGPAPTTLSLTAFRPAFNFRAANSATNDASIVGFQPMGQISKLDGLSQVVTVQVRNNSNVAINIAGGLAVTGANTFVDTKTLTAVPAGSIQTMTFNGFVSNNNGSNLIAVNLYTDQVNSNNASGTYTQNVSCSEIAITPVANATAFTNNAWVSGSSGGIMAFKYTTGPNTTSLVSVNFVVPSFTNAGNAGNSVYPVLCDASGSVLNQGNPVTLTAANMDSHYPFAFTSPVALTPNTTYYFGLACPSTTNGPFGFSPAGSTILGHYRIPLNGGAPVQSDLDFVGVSASIISNAISLTAATTKTNICKADKWLLTASGANSYTWTPNASTSTVTTNFTAIGVIPYSVVGTATNGCKTNKASITFSVSNCTGLDNNATYGAEISSFPNPSVDGKVTIAGLEGTNTITVYNVLGQAISTSTSSDSSVEIDLSNEAAGNYMVKVSNGDAFKMIKVISKN
ncbi:MAG: T9SS type A sorting domain-containing protein [Bacteroidia bacterium]|nr:T9SS type A sorting domain-containing protein [Bacteroidia bacterium]